MLHPLGSLRAAAGTSDSDLTAALHDVGQAMEGGHAADSLLSAIRQDAAFADLLPPTPLTRDTSTTRTLVTVRSSPHAALDPAMFAADAGGAGMLKLSLGSGPARRTRPPGAAIAT